MPSLVTKLVDNVEIKIRKRAFVTIHVDDNRLSNLDNNAIVIYNAPYDFLKEILSFRHIKRSLLLRVGYHLIEGWILYTILHMIILHMSLL